MPSEVRQLLFKSREVIVAITEYFHRRGLVLPNGTAERVILPEGRHVHALLIIATDRGGKVEVEVNTEMLAAALILFCINRKIPLPVESDKRLQRIQEDSVALVVVKRSKT